MNCIYRNVFSLLGVATCFVFLVNFSFGQSIENNYFTLYFNKSDGTLFAKNRNGTDLFTGSQQSIFTENRNYCSGADNYTYYIKKRVKSNNEPVLIIQGSDKNKHLNYTTVIELVDSIPAIYIEVIYENISDHPIQVGSVVPLRLIKSESGSLTFIDAELCLTNGAMYYDAGMIHALDENYIKPEPYGELKGGIPFEHSILRNPKTAQSWWNIGIFSDHKKESMVIGYLKNTSSLGRIQLLKETDQQLSLVVESVFNPGFELKPHAKISSDKIVILRGNNPFEVLETYASVLTDCQRKRPSTIINGWCNWFYTMDIFDESEILQNALFASHELKSYGMEYIQIDEGFQITHGNWNGNNRFPHGMKWLCDSIKAMGLKPGIWLAPLVISENSEVYMTHPEWLVKDMKGNPARIGPWPNEDTDWYRNESPKRYCLDITHPGAVKWLTALIDTVANQWGFEMIKIDFVAWTVLSAYRFVDPGISPAQAYRKALQIIRQTAGENCHILECGPGNVTSEFINSMRIEYDQNYGYRENAWKQYFGGSSSSAGAAGKRYYFHNKSWINDIDHLCMDLLPGLNSQAAATLISLSGGNIMSGDRLINLENTKLDILKKVLPGTIENGRPVDLLENDPQTVFSCHISRDFAQWDLIAFFNPDPDQIRTVKYGLERFWLDTTKVYLCFDFWNEKFVGEITDSLQTTIFPGSVSLFSMHIKTGFPQVIATNRHIKQGAVELNTVRYDHLNYELSGTSIAPRGTKHSVFIYIPETYYWQPQDSRIYELNEQYSARMVSNNILRIDVSFNKAEMTSWKIHFNPVTE